MPAQARLLLIIEDAGLRARLEEAMMSRGYQVIASGDAGGAPDAIVLEFPGLRGRGQTRLARASTEARSAIVVLCPHGMVEAGVTALKGGADDFLLAPFDLEELEIRVERAMSLHRSTRPSGVPPDAGPVRLRGSSVALSRVREQVARVAPGRATVLITGETGTGKELVAGLIHEASPRRDRPMIKVNCAALPDPLLESELFGHERGAFTGAEQRRIGRFEEADGGTLFLDEIGDMHLRTQAKVLRALQEQEFERLGATNTVRVDVRVIAATNQDLRGRIASGDFREDLFFRLNVVPMELPPLREHPEDIPELIEEFLAEHCAAGSSPRRGLRPEALTFLQGYPWPGNVRELRNVLERAVLMGEALEIGLEDLGLLGENHPGSARDPAAPGPRPVILLPPDGIDHREAERLLILAALERAGWVQKEAAWLLRMSRRKLNYRIQRLGITHPGWRRNRSPA